MMFSAGRLRPNERMQGDFDQDASNGLWHFQTGLSEGITKTISLQKATAPGLQEVRFEQDGYDGLRQLRETFDATINTYPLPGIYPGTYIYIDPRSWTPGNTRYFTDSEGKTIDLTDLGLGGYYMVIRSTTSLAPGKANTEITAKWVASIENEFEQREREKRDGDSPVDSKDTTKCNQRIGTGGWTPESSRLPADESPDTDEVGVEDPAPVAASADVEALRTQLREQGWTEDDIDAELASMHMDATGIIVE